MDTLNSIHWNSNSLSLSQVHVRCLGIWILFSNRWHAVRLACKFLVHHRVVVILYACWLRPDHSSCIHWLGTPNGGTLSATACMLLAQSCWEHSVLSPLNGNLLLHIVGVAWLALSRTGYFFSMESKPLVVLSLSKCNFSFRIKLCSVDLLVIVPGIFRVLLKDFMNLTNRCVMNLLLVRDLLFRVVQFRNIGLELFTEY